MDDLNNIATEKSLLLKPLYVSGIGCKGWWSTGICKKKDGDILTFCHQPLPSTHVWCLVSYHFFIGHVSGMSRSIDSSIHHPFITFVIPLWNHDLSWWRCRRWSYFLHKHKRCFFMCFCVIDHFSSFFWKCWREMSQISLWYMGVSQK